MCSRKHTVSCCTNENVRGAPFKTKFMAYNSLENFATKFLFALERGRDDGRGGTKQRGENQKMKKLY